MNEKGIVFTIDMMIGITLVILILFLIPIKFESNLPELSYQKLSYNSEDAINVLSTLKTFDVKDKPTIKNLIDTGFLKDADMNKTVLDLIGSLWFNTNYTIAANITNEVLGNLVKDFCFNLTTSDGQTIYSSCSTSSNIVTVKEKIVSGYQIGKPVEGFVARARATQVAKNTSSYAYFGGFIGQGNITRNVTINNMTAILEAYMEMYAGGSFNLYINGNYSGIYTPSYQQMRADNWTVCNTTYNPSICSNFREGENQLRFVFTANDSYIGGGFFRTIYNTTILTDTQNNSIYYFPGIEGLINVFDSLYVPGILNSMSAYIHFKSNYTTFLTIANSTIWENASGGIDKYITISNADIIGNITRDGLSYSNFSKTTVPIRIGLRNVSFITGSNPAHVALSTDVSGSMSGSPLAEAKAADKDLVTIVLDNPDNLVAINNYSTSIRGVESLTTNELYLNNSIDSYIATGNTCICCGINAGTFSLLDGRTGWLKSSGGSLSGTYSSSGGTFSSTNLKDSKYWYFGSINNDYDITANATLNFTIPDMGITSNATAMVAFLNYCHDGSGSSPAACDGDSAEGSVQGTQDVFAYNFSSNSWMDIGDLRTNDNGYTVLSNYSVSGNVSHFIDSSGNISVRMELDYSNGQFQDSWLVMDYAAINITYPHQPDKFQDFTIIMSDGQANVLCGEQGTGNSDNDAINAACYAKNTHNITVHAVGFGSGADNATLQSIANCGGGQYFYASSGQLQTIFKNLAGGILNGSYIAQLLEVGQAGDTVLYPDSYVYLNFTPTTTLNIGELSISMESSRFGGNVSSPKNGWFSIPSNTRVVDAKATSYSSSYWTDRLIVNGVTVYNLSVYAVNNANYTTMGDPYIVQIPVDKVVVGNNSVSIDTGFSASNVTGGSPDDKVLFTVAIDASVGYGDVFENQTAAVDDARNRLNQVLSQFAGLINFDTDLLPTGVGGVPGLWGPTLFKIVAWSR
ncbi:MAG TPA: hypothetical protein VJH34_03815 [archaeon]|nr:hypothetical protein [archaeon]